MATAEARVDQAHAKQTGGGRGVVVLLTRGWKRTEAWGAPQASCLSVNPAHTGQLGGPRWFSMAAVIQLPGRQTRAAPKTHNNPPELEISDYSAVLSAV